MLSSRDRQAILDRSNRYYHDLDFSRWDDVAAHFTRDAQFESKIWQWAHYQEVNPTLSLSMFGRDWIRDLLPLMTLEVASPHRIQRLDDRSVATESDVRYRHPSDPSHAWLTGRCRNRLTKLESGWQIAHHLIIIDWDSHPDATIGRSVISGIDRPAPPSIDITSCDEGSQLSPRDTDDIIEVLQAFGTAMGLDGPIDALNLCSPDVRFEAPVRWWAVHAPDLPNHSVAVVGKPNMLQWLANSGGGKAPEPGELVDEGDVRVLHEVTTGAIEGDQREARLIRYFGFYFLDNPPKQTIAGRYEIRLRQEDGTWRFSHVDCKFEWSIR